jgi:hypothetical protein
LPPQETQNQYYRQYPNNQIFVHSQLLFVEIILTKGIATLWQATARTSTQCWAGRGKVRLGLIKTLPAQADIREKWSAFFRMKSSTVTDHGLHNYTVFHTAKL